MNKAVFLDRDGTLIKDGPYLSNPDDIKLLPYVSDGIRLLNQHGFLVVIVTNQSGVARGYFTVDMVNCIHHRLLSLLKQNGAMVHGVYFCPHHPDDLCDCRKPNVLLFQQAVHDFSISTRESFMVGDSWCDVDAGKRMGLRTVLVHHDGDGYDADYHARDFADAIWFILRG